MGTISALDPEETGIVWFDAHAEFNTPETTTSGFLDGLGLAVAVGDCWRTMARTVPGFRPALEGNVLLVGGRVTDEAERARLQSSDVSVVGAGAIRNGSIAEALGSALDPLVERVRAVYLHLDLDVLDPALAAPASEYAPSGGLTAEEVEVAIRMLRERFVLAAAGIASYDPSYDAERKVLRAAIDLSKALVS